MFACPVTQGLRFADTDLQFAVRRRLGVAACFEGPDPHGHCRLATSLGGGLHARHSTLIAAWRQVFVEAGGQVPKRNVERMLRSTWVRVPEWDNRRLDLVVPGLNVEGGMPLFCDVTIVSPISRSSAARPGTSNLGGSLLERAENGNHDTYEVVLQNRLACLKCLGCEVYGRWGQQCIDLVPRLARERVRCMAPRVRRGIAFKYQKRWWTLLGIALQKAVMRMGTNDPHEGADLFEAALEPAPHLAEL